MSRLKIYRINDPDPVKMGRKSRRIFAVYSILAIVIWLIVNIHITNDHRMTFYYTIFLPVALMIFIFLILKLRHDTRKIKTIGDIEFTTSLIRKKLSITETMKTLKRMTPFEIKLP